MRNCKERDRKQTNRSPVDVMVVGEVKIDRRLMSEVWDKVVDDRSSSRRSKLIDRDNRS